MCQKHDGIISSLGFLGLAENRVHGTRNAAQKTLVLGGFEVESGKWSKDSFPNLQKSPVDCRQKTFLSSSPHGIDGVHAPDDDAMGVFHKNSSEVVRAIPKNKRKGGNSNTPSKHGQARFGSDANQ